MIVDGYIQCPKCRSHMTQFPVCRRCNTNYDEWRELEMVNNLKKFGFEEVVVYHPQNLIQRIFLKKKVSDRYLRWGKIIARKYGTSSNRYMYFDGKPICVFNTYGDYDNVKVAIKLALWEYIRENDLWIKSKRREGIINKIIFDEYI